MRAGILRLFCYLQTLVCWIIKGIYISQGFHLWWTHWIYIMNIQPHPRVVQEGILLHFGNISLMNPLLGRNLRLSASIVIKWFDIIRRVIMLILIWGDVRNSRIIVVGECDVLPETALYCCIAVLLFAVYILLFRCCPWFDFDSVLLYVL